ncbi:hypothetical protein [Roseibium sp. RKSG952]|uniref:hypothetical protein n=1 Tax=Roseibium sp. RKSG952 TaxID=2529384 RepID=UPI0012BC7426|nr:hypothetical protein [Roseibium sp. RKSG952]MTI03696.1 hypothetical protein [Roseibium sp. RKSG952]
MLLKETKNWIKEERSRGVLFLVQRIDELTYPYTIDSYRAPTTNAPFLARECLSVLDDYEEHDVNPAHVERIWEELEARMSGNFVAKSIMRVPWEEYNKVDKNDFDAIKGMLRVISTELQPIKYLQCCFDFAKETAPNELERMDFLAREIVTTAVNCGIDVAYLSKLVGDYFFGAKAREDDEALEDFFQEIIPKRRKYSVHLTVKTDDNLVKKEISDLFSVQVSADEPPAISGCGETLELGEGEVFITIQKIEVPDPFNALSVAKKTVARLQDMYGLFYHKGSYKIGRHALILQDGDEVEVFKLRADVNSMEFIRDNRKGLAGRKLEGLIKKVNLPVGSDREKFFRVVDFHGMSLGSEIPENQLINLWTSLETIAPSQKAKSIVGSVVDGIVPFIGLQYLSRIFGNLTRDLKRWDDAKLKSALRSGDISKDLTLTEQVFSLTVLPEHDETCSKLLAHMDEFPLLRKRIFELNKKCQSGEKLVSWVEKHQRNVEQQIYRIYRARNSIVHSASDSRSIGNLIVSAHDYFDQTFALSSEMCSRPYGFSNYSESFSFCRLAYKKYKADISKIEEISEVDVSTVIWGYD